MRLHSFVIILRLFTLAAFGVLGVFVFGTDPATLTLAGESFFFGALGLFVMGVAALILLSLARRFIGEEAAHVYLVGALRQGALLGLWVTAIASMQFVGYLTWWIALLSLALVLLIEFTVRQFIRN